MNEKEFGDWGNLSKVYSQQGALRSEVSFHFDLPRQVILENRGAGAVAIALERVLCLAGV